MRKGTQIASAGALIALVSSSFWYERYQPIVACLSLLALAVLVRSLDWWPRHRLLVIAIGIDVALNFLYLWSLDERVHVVIQGMPTQYAAQLGSGTATLPILARVRNIGFSAGTQNGYAIKATGDAVTTDGSPLQRLFELVRFAAPRPAWANVSLSVEGGPASPVALTPRRDMPRGSWSVNRRGELEGSLGAVTSLRAQGGPIFTLQADLMRPDGYQGILFGLHQGRYGYAFQVGDEGTSGQWLVRIGTRTWATTSQTGSSFDAVASAQHSVRLFLGNVIAGALLILLALVSYVVLAWLATLYRGRFISWPQWRIPVRSLDAVAVLSALTATIAAALIADKLLQRLPHVVDSVAYYFQAENLASGRLWRAEPLHPHFFHIGYTLVHAGRWFGKYPPGWPLVLAAGVALGIPWLVNPVLTGLNVILIYFVGSEAYGRRVGLVAAVLALSSPYLLALGADYLSHTAEVTFLLLATWLFLLWRRHLPEDSASPAKHWTFLMPAGFCLGMAFIIRNLDPIPYALPFLALLPRQSVRRLLPPLGWLALGAAIPLAFNLVYNWQLTGSALLSPYLLSDPYDHPGFGVPRGMVGYFTIAEGLWILVSHLEALFGHLFGWPFYLTLALAVIPFLLVRAKRTDLVFGGSALAVMLAYVTYFSGGPSYDPRYWAPAVPPLILLTARGFQELFRLSERLPRGIPRSRIAAMAFPAALAFFLLAGDAFVYLPAQLPIYKGYYSVSARFTRPLQRLRPRKALVFIGPGGPRASVPPDWNEYGVWLALLMNSPDPKGDAVFAKNLGAHNLELIRQYPHREYYIFDGRTIVRLILKQGRPRVRRTGFTIAI